MSVDNLTFEDIGQASVIYDPLLVSTTMSKIVRVTNYGETDLTNLGVYITVATTIGDVDNPADFPPETDYQDLLSWGEATLAGLYPSGGLKLSLPQNDGSIKTNYISRKQGSSRSNKLQFKDLAAGSSAEFTIELENQPGAGARRLFVNLVIDQ